MTEAQDNGSVCLNDAPEGTNIVVLQCCESGFVSGFDLRCVQLQGRRGEILKDGNCRIRQNRVEKRNKVIAFEKYTFFFTPEFVSIAVNAKACMLTS